MNTIELGSGDTAVSVVIGGDEVAAKMNFRKLPLSLQPGQSIPSHFEKGDPYFQMAFTNRASLRVIRDALKLLDDNWNAPGPGGWKQVHETVVKIELPHED